MPTKQIQRRRALEVVRARDGEDHQGAEESDERAVPHAVVHLAQALDEPGSCGNTFQGHAREQPLPGTVAARLGADPAAVETEALMSDAANRLSLRFGCGPVVANLQSQLVICRRR